MARHREDDLVIRSPGRAVRVAAKASLSKESDCRCRSTIDRHLLESRPAVYETDPFAVWRDEWLARRTHISDWNSVELIEATNEEPRGPSRVHDLRAVR